MTYQIISRPPKGRTFKMVDADPGTLFSSSFLETVADQKEASWKNGTCSDDATSTLENQNLNEEFSVVTLVHRCSGRRCQVVGEWSLSIWLTPFRERFELGLVNSTRNSRRFGAKTVAKIAAKMGRDGYSITVEGSIIDDSQLPLKEVG